MTADQDEKTIYPPLTEKDFNDGTGYEFRGIPLCEDEGGSWVFAYGHRNKHRYAGAVNDYDYEMTGDKSLPKYTGKDVEHRYAVALQPADGPDGWFITWGRDAREHPLRFPVTVVSR